MALGDRRQSCRCLLMVRPEAFGFNPETAATNAYQVPSPGLDRDIAAAARREFDACVESLSAAGASPLVFPDLPGGASPDAVFPNNWVSFHGDGTAILYPLAAPGRRRERRPDLPAELARAHGFHLGRVIDLTGLEARGRYLEGTGSLVLDRCNHVAYAALSPRTDAAALAEFAARSGYRVVAFATRGPGGPVYHTNVVLGLGTGLAVCGAGMIEPADRDRVLGELRAGDREVLVLGEAEVAAFAANLLEIEAGGAPAFVLSRRALAALAPDQRRILERHGGLVPVSVDTIERVGGGGVRCMLAEVHLPRAEAGALR